METSMMSENLHSPPSPSLSSISSSSCPCFIDGVEFPELPASLASLLKNPAAYHKVSRPPPRSETRRQDFYLTAKTPKRSVYKRILKLFEDDKLNHLNLYGLGTAINGVIEVALSVSGEIQTKFNKQQKLHLEFNQKLVRTCHTGTVELFDDYEPRQPENPRVSIMRKSSRIHIQLAIVEENQQKSNSKENTENSMKKQKT